MTRRILSAALLVVSLAAFSLPALAQEGMDASTNRPERPAYAAWLRGRDAERAGKPQQAFDAYAEALRLEPANPEYRVLVERMRFTLAEALSNQAERAMLADNPAEAATQLRRALSVDPANAVARERLRQLERQAIQESPVTPEYAADVPELSPQPGTRDFNYRGPVRGAYLEIARQFGLLAVFDEDISNAQVRFSPSGLDFNQAFSLLGQQTGTFIRALDSRSFLVLNDTPQKRKEYLPQIERTLLLPESEKPEQMNEIVRAVRDITGITHTQFDTRTHTLTVRGSLRDVALASALIRQIEQPRGEIMLEINILEVDRNSAENLGIVPPSSAQVVTLSQQQLQLAQSSTEGLVQVIEQLFGLPAAFAGSSAQQISTLLGTGATSLSALVPPLIAFGGGNTIFLATLPGATANFADSVSVVQNAQRILLRAQDGEPATFFVGERYPINLTSLSNSFTTAGNVPAITGGLVSTDTSPRGVAVAVLRSSSSFLDIITANHDAGTVSVLLGDGDGTFQTQVAYPAGTNPVALTAATFRAAGSPVDLAVVDQGTNNVQILLGNGDGTFQAPVAYPVGAQPSGIVAADFNADGIMDLAVTNTAGNSISILLGNGDGSFLPATTIPLPHGQGPVGIATADFNTDGSADLIVANTLTNTVTLLFGDGHGNFTAQPDIDTGTFPVAVAVADFNGDSHPDFAVANRNDGTVSVFINTGTTGNAVFATQDVFTVGGGPDALIAADVNNDSHPDLVSANSSDGSLTVLFGAGDGTFPANASPLATPSLDCSTLPAPGIPCQGLASGDFNADGLLDVVVTDATNNTAAVIINSQQLAVANAQLPYPGSQYEDIGVKAKVTPHIHPSGEVTLALNFEIRALSTVSINGIPILINRTLEQTVRLRPGEPSVLSGIFSDQETLAITGTPGAGEVPVFQDLLTNRNPQVRQNELVVVVTPRLVRISPRSPGSFYAGHERQASIGQGGSEIEQPEQPQPAPPQPPRRPGENPSPTRPQP